MPKDPVTLTAATLVTVIRWRQAEPHPVLADTPAWRDDQARLAADERARAELIRLGLSTERELATDFEVLMGAMVRPDRELFGWIDTTVDGRPASYGVLAAVAYRRGFVLIREHGADLVVLASIHADELLDGFVAQLPAAPAAPGEPISVPYDDYAAAIAPGPRDGFSGFGGLTHPDVRALREIFTQPRTGAGNLYAAGRSQSGTRLRIEHPVNYIDTAEGRWLTQLSTRNGQRWATATPATTRLIARTLCEAPLTQ